MFEAEWIFTGETPSAIHCPSLPITAKRPSPTLPRGKRTFGAAPPVAKPFPLRQMQPAREAVIKRAWSEIGQPGFVSWASRQTTQTFCLCWHATRHLR
jgi:hypothetical protein